MIVAMPDVWLTCNHFLGKVSVIGQPTRRTQPSSGVGKWVVIHLITLLRGWRPLNSRPGCVWLVSYSSVCGLRPIGCMSALSVTWTAPLQLRYVACGVIQVLYAFALCCVCNGVQQHILGIGPRKAVTQQQQHSLSRIDRWLCVQWPVAGWGRPELSV